MYKNIIIQGREQNCYPDYNVKSARIVDSLTTGRKILKNSNYYLGLYRAYYLEDGTLINLKMFDRNY